MKKAIIFDLDGTAVDSPHQKLPSDFLTQTMQEMQDNYFLSAATGRVWSFAKPVLQTLKLQDPCIISAGTQICDPQSGSILWQKTISDKSLQKVIEVFAQYPEYKLLYNDATEDDYFHGGWYPHEIHITKPVYFLEQVFVPDDVADKIQKELSVISGIAVVMVVSQKPGCRDIHIVHAQATKEHAIEELLIMLGVQKSDTIGIGDGHNDLHLFNAVGHKVAMGNAVKELKAASDLVIDTVSKDGLAHYLKTLVRKY